jgi:alkane 1-monooxygenase
MMSRISYSLFPPLFIALIPVGLLFGIPWLGILVGGGIVPIIDEVIGRGGTAQAGPSRLEVRAVLLVILAMMGWSLARVAELDSWLMIVLAGASSGYILGAIGIAAAHELGHRRSAFDRFLSQALLACIGYGHYQVAHSRHHVRAGLPDDPATARREEGLWRFLPRYWFGVWRDATEAASSSRGLRRHKPALLLLATLAMFGGVGARFGATGVVFWSVQAALSLFLIASVDYIQHWGLRRKKLENGHHEKTTAAHTWEAPFWLSERVTLNLTRHSFHHLSPGKECAAIERVPAGPQMPLSYGTMVLVAAIPPLFQRIMAPHLPAMDEP